MGRATIVEEPTEELENNVEVEELESQDTTDEVAEDPVQEQPDDDIPEKYRGKSVKEIIEMHQNAEKHIGKQSSEVGELRKVVDDFIRGQTSKQQETAPSSSDEDEDVDFFLDPDTAVSKKIDSHPAIREAKEYAQQQKIAATLSQLQAKHPDMETIVKNPSFAEWIKSSKIRTELFVRADQQYDYDAADALFSDWKDRQGVATQAAATDKQARKNAVKSAATGNARGTGEPSRRKVYRRSDIIKLMQTDPQRYQDLQPEIMKAYQEGRVK